MGYLYGEISAEERQKVEAWLREHPEDRAELQQLQETRSWLAAVPAAPTKTTLNFPTAKSKRLWAVPRLAWIGAAAAVLLLLLTTLGTSVTVSEKGMTIAFGQPALSATANPESQAWQKQILEVLAENDEATEQRLDSIQRQVQHELLQQQKTLLQDWQAQLARHDALQRKKLEQFAMEYYQKEVPIMIANVQDMQLEQREELQVILNEMWNDWLAVRSADLQIIQASMDDLQENIERNQNQTQVLEDILVQAYR